MIRDKAPEKSKGGVTQNSEGLKRRDLLLSGTSLVAASALLGADWPLPRKRSNRQRRRQPGNSRTSLSS
jgi:hypothetical protein